MMTPRSESGPVRVFVVAALAGVLAGLAATGLKFALEGASDLREHLVSWTDRSEPHGQVFLVAALTLLLPVATTSVAALLVHRVEPHAEGSGIPRVTAVVQGHAAPGRLRILPVKFAGGVLAIGGGLALGREGPSVHMGGVLASVCGRWARLSTDEVRIVIAGGAAAGLATAFNAPIAGGVFVLEELLRRFDPRSTLATLAASGAGFAVTHLLHADAVVFSVPTLPVPRLEDAPVVLVLGLVCGVCGVAYNAAVLGALRFVDRTKVSLLGRTATIGLLAGVLLLVHPAWAGSGDALTQGALTGHGVVGTVVVLLLVRFVFGVLSYAANTPGGLFAPMLVIGANVGLLLGLLADRIVALPVGTSAGLALVGLAAFFTATVQAPVTGLILATEMTGSTSWLAPMLGAVAMAMLVARVLGSAPIYDSLAERSARNAGINAREKVTR